MSDDEITAIRHPNRGKAHRVIPLRTTVWTARKYQDGNHKTIACKPSMLDAIDNLTERVPLSQTDPKDRCRICWPVAASS